MSKVIDYRQTYWGHNFSSYPGKSSDEFSALVWYRAKVAKGDHVLWKTNYGYAKLEVIDSVWKVDPSDMYKVELKVIERYDNEDNRLDG